MLTTTHGDRTVAPVVSYGRRRGRRIDTANILENTGVEELVEDEAAGRDGRPAMMIGGGGVEVEAEASGSDRRRRKVGLGFGPAEGTGGAVVGKRRLLRSVECTQPNPRLLPGIAYLGGVSTPWSLSDPSVVTLTRRGRRRRRRRRSHDTMLPS